MDNAAKHTPGPWEVAENGTTVRPVRRGIGRAMVASVGDLCISSQYSEDAANARLIAAAPDMLTALREFVERGNTTTVLVMAKAAVARADGRAS